MGDLAEHHALGPSATKPEGSTLGPALRYRRQFGRFGNASTAVGKAMKIWFSSLSGQQLAAHQGIMQKVGRGPRET